MPRVNIQGYGVVNFPDTMSHDEIANAIENDILPNAQAKTAMSGEADGGITPIADIGTSNQITPSDPRYNEIMQRARSFQAGERPLLEGGNVPKEMQGMLFPSTLEARAAGNILQGLGKAAGIEVGRKDIVQGAIEKAAEAPINALTNLFGFTTDKGASTIKEIYNRAVAGDKSAVKAMRGEITPDVIVGHAQDAMQALKNERGQAYRERLANLKNSDVNIDLAPIKDKLSELAENANIKKGPDGKWDFSRSSISDSADRNKLKKLFTTVEDWGSKEGDNLPASVDILKRMVDDFYSPAKESRALVGELRSTIKSNLIKNVPEYEQMVGDYEKASAVMEDITKELSVGGNASMDTVLNKLSKAMNDDASFKNAMLKKLTGASGKDIAGELAGYQMSSYAPKGSARGLVTAELMLSAFTANPKLLLALAGSSPRVVGNFFNALGVAKNVSDKIVNRIPFGMAKNEKKMQQTLSALSTIGRAINQNGAEYQPEVQQRPNPMNLQSALSGPVVR